MAALLFLAGACLVGVLSWRDRAEPGGPGLFSSGPDFPQTANRRYQGRTVDEWGPELLDANFGTSFAASEALARLGDEALRWFKRGLESEYPHVRLHSMVRFSTDDLNRYKGTLEPIFLRLAETEQENLYPVADNLSRMRSERGRPIIERRAKADTLPARRTALFELLAKWGR